MSRGALHRRSRNRQLRRRRWRQIVAEQLPRRAPQRGAVGVGLALPVR